VQKVPRSLVQNDYLANKMSVTIQGCPLHFGQPHKGVSKGPFQLRSENRLVDKLQELGWEIKDNGDADFSPIQHLIEEHTPETGAKYSRYVGQACETLSNKTKQAALEKNLALTLGGDHSSSIGSIAGLLQVYSNLGVVWVDAHADINTPTTSHSKNIHGMSIAFLMNLQKCRDTLGFEWMKVVPNLPPRQVVYVGLRDIDAAEKQFIVELGLKAYDMHDIDKYGIGTVMERAIEHISGRANLPIHLSFDIDALDPMYAPATGTSVHGGLTYREASYVAEFLSKTRRLVGMDIVEVNPDISLNKSHHTAEFARSLVLSALGNTTL